MLATTRIRFRLALAIVLTALIPVVAAIVLSRSMVQQSSARFFMPEIGERLEQSLEAYRELVRATKASMRHQASAMASDPKLLASVATQDADAITSALERLMTRYPQAVSLEIKAPGGQRLAAAQRESLSNPAAEYRLVVSRDLDLPTKPHVVVPHDAQAQDNAATRNNAALQDDAGAPWQARATADAGTPGNAVQLVAAFATSKRPFEQFQTLGEFIDAYSHLEERRDSVERTYVLAFAALLGVTIVLAIGVGILMARTVARRVSELARATRKVGAGDLSVRVSEAGRDEITELARGFNQMLQEVDKSRSRIEYLSRLASWQEMARRLAHEIKNPLTPIQLAVQEVHQRLSGSNPEQQKLLDSTLEIVGAEVQTLRRLVGEFSEFARLPESRMEDADLFQYLREIEEQSQSDAEFFEYDRKPRATLSFRIPSDAAPVELDRHMMRRVLVNLIRNAFEAVGPKPDGKIVVSASWTAPAYVLCVDDSGPGVPPELRPRVFEPYVTSKDDGTGLGLAIVKKIIIDHGGIIDMQDSDLGGARVKIQLPRVRGSLPAQR